MGDPQYDDVVRMDLFDDDNCCFCSLVQTLLEKINLYSCYDWNLNFLNYYSWCNDGLD
jgi:hypothetical protein